MLLATDLFVSCKIHFQASLSHNNVCLSSVFVSVNDWAWRLGGMEHACKHPELTNEVRQFFLK